MLGVTSHFCRSSRYQVSWHGHIRIRWDTVNFCCCTCHIDHGSFCHPRHSRHFGAHAQFKVAWFELDEEADYMPKRLSDFPKCAVFTQRFEQLLPDTSLLIKSIWSRPSSFLFPVGSLRRRRSSTCQNLPEKAAESKKEGNETVVRGCFLRLSKEISEGIRRSVSRLAERKNGTRQSARPIKWASVAWTPNPVENSHNQWKITCFQKYTTTNLITINCP